MSGKAMNEVSGVSEVSNVSAVDRDVTMVDLSVDEDEALLSTKEVEVITVPSDSEEEDGFPYYTMREVIGPKSLDSDEEDGIPYSTLKEIVSPKVGPVTRRPRLKFRSQEQTAAHREKYGEHGDKLRRTVETYRVKKVTRISKVHYRPIKDQVAPVWRHRAEVVVGKLLQGGTEEISDQVTKITREEFVDRAADKAVEQIMGPKIKQTRADWENRMLEREYQREEEVEDTH